MIPPHLRIHLEPLAIRRQAVRRLSFMALAWAVAALAGLGVLLVEYATGTAYVRAWPLIALLGAAAALTLRHIYRYWNPDWHALAADIEHRFPELDGRLITALDQEPGDTGHLGYLQLRVVRECLDHHRYAPWHSRLSFMWLRAARGLHAGAFAAFAIVVATLAVRGGGLAPGGDPSIARGVSVTPGDVTLERGDTLVVMARFDGREPAAADLVLTRDGEPDTRIPLVKSLADPMFGISVPAVDRDLLYRVEFDGRRTQSFEVDVFEYPRLERADAEIAYPEYTGQPNKHIPDTRRVSAVEGSLLDLALRLNKPVAKAVLLPDGLNDFGIELELDSAASSATLSGLALSESLTFLLALTDEQGRTNRTPDRFVVNVYPNRPPEMKIAAPRGDSRPSPLEEMTFEGTVWDDFGVQAYGVAYSLAGSPPTFITLGEGAPSQEKLPYRHVLALEDLGVEAEDFLSWYLWADDIGPQGEPRRTLGDMYFAEVRPFDEIFREGQRQAGGQGGGEGGEEGGEGGGGAGDLTETMRELINATWRLQREAASSRPGTADPDQTRHDRPAPAGSPEPQPVVYAASHAQTLALPAVAGLPGPGLFAQAAAESDLERRWRQFLEQSDASTTADAPAEDPRSDVQLLQDAQAAALSMAREARENQQDPLAIAQWDRVIEWMQTALDKLKDAESSPAAFQDANAAQKDAMQALLRLQQREYSVSQRNQQQQNQSANSRQRQMQSQLNQLEMTPTEDRYETESQAAAPQTDERREELQIMSRLRELARRQQDLNQRFQELQTALQEARTEEEREEIRRELKRLQDEERQMLEDVDELQQRMDSPENQSRMAEQRRQLEQTREEIQRAAEAAERGEASQALAAGSRAERGMEEMREQMRRENAGEFSEQMRRMRAEARELARRQERIREELDESGADRGRSLRDDANAPAAQEQLAEQAERVDRLLNEMTEMTRLAEDAEPLMSGELYDSLRRYTQDDQELAQQVEQDLIEQGLMTRDLYDRLRQLRQDSETRMLESTAELLREGYLPEARQTESGARAGISTLREGIERAAERVLGDETEALRLARQQLDDLTDALNEEMQEAQEQAQAQAQDQARASGQGQSEEPGERGGPGEPGEEREPGESGEPGEPGEPREAESEQRLAESGQERGGEGGEGDRPPGSGGGGEGGEGGREGEPSFPFNLEEFVERGGLRDRGPITGGGFGGWSDQLREVEELVDDPALSGELARARERARLFRQAYRREGERPDWELVSLEVMGPLVEVRDAVSEDLARREPRDQLVPIDRDAVPTRYEELVRRYYEALGKNE